uniref:HP1D2B n=1 Tax=Drosophila prostipennis TaxID=94111 RepID=A0A142I124_9MUSC|nr:HP1D2B [Drosophila prostipennis]
MSKEACASNTALRGASAGGGAAAIDDQDDDQSAEYEVEKLMAHSYLRGRKQFLVKWKGYPIDQCTWEPMEEMQNCLAALIDYDEEDFIKIMKNTKEAQAKIKQKEEPKQPSRKTSAVPTYVMVNDKEYSPEYSEQEEFRGFDSITWVNIEKESSSNQVKGEQMSPTVAIMDLSDDESVGASISSVAHTDEASRESITIQAKRVSPTVAQEHEFPDEGSLPSLGTGETESLTSTTNASLPWFPDDVTTDDEESADEFPEEGSLPSLGTGETESLTSKTNASLPWFPDDVTTDDEESTDDEMAGAASGETENPPEEEPNSWLTACQIKTQLRLDKLLADLERTISEKGLYLNLTEKKRGWRMPQAPEPYGAARGLKLEKVHNCFKVREQLFFCVTKKARCTMDAVPLWNIKYLYPEIIIEFLETLKRA